MKVSGQFVVVLGLAGTILAVAAYESAKPESDPKIVEWARGQQGGGSVTAEPRLLSRARGRIPDEPEELSTDGGESEQEMLAQLSGVDLPRLIERAFGGGAGLFGDDVSRDERVLSGQYGEWDFFPGTDSLLDAPGTRELMEQVLGDGFSDR